MGSLRLWANLLTSEEVSDFVIPLEIRSSVESQGDAKSTIDYCKKDGKIYREEGECAKPGRRSHLMDMREHFKARKRNIDAIEDNNLIEKKKTTTKVVGKACLHGVT